MIHIALVDDHLLFREGIKAIFQEEKNMEISLEASDGNEFLNSLRSAVVKPNVVLLDIRMPNLDGYATAELLLTEYPDMKIIVLTMHEEERHIIRMIELGVNGYLMKNASPDEVLESIDCVMEHDYYFNNKITNIMRKVMMYKGKRTADNSMYELTEREIEVLELICKEFTAKEIGEKLFISFRTVEGHRKKLLSKLNVRNTAGLVVLALKNEIVQI
ncbi:response regulator transcription factor [Kordia sp. YSTF-M3]|uniref:Response regulator transcription factor n=1 Tax=Kordia aestuariivivens TaxID=2759037 RepID=A0ABR7QCD0_9FLAO|nr:response regulator transcription factor [Kordia aestuariivivens]MBC8756236.1 response regulator transcription factor [Kordia aestuariivivens]